MDIAVENLSVSFGEKQVLRTLSLTFPAGSCTAVMGPSGSGKTTLLRVLMGLEKAYEGKVSGIPEKRSAVFQEDRLAGFLQRARQPAPDTARHKKRNASSRAVPARADGTRRAQACAQPVRRDEAARSACTRNAGGR